MRYPRNLEFLMLFPPDCREFSLESDSLTLRIGQGTLPLTVVSFWRRELRFDDYAVGGHVADSLAFLVGRDENQAQQV